MDTVAHFLNPNGNGKANGKANGNGRITLPVKEVSPASVDEFRRLNELVADYAEKLKTRDPQQTYLSGDADRMNPVPRGINPLGTDADYHYRTERNYFLHVERGRHAVRNHPLVEQGINRLVANLRLNRITLDVESGDKGVDAECKAFWRTWSANPSMCDHEHRRTFQQIACQSMFSQVQDGDIIHLPTADGCIQTWESHHLRNPWGRMPTGSDVRGIIHGVEVNDGRTIGFWITPRNLLFNQVVQRGESRFHAAYDGQGNKLVFWLGFTHRFGQRRGISRLSAPREAMQGFDDLNYAHIKSALRRALLAYLMQSTAQAPSALPFGGVGVPQAGSRYSRSDIGLGLESIVIEQLGEPAQVFKTPDGYRIDGWNANMPSSGFFEHASLMLTMLAVNLDLPLSFFLLDGSLVNFHGGRMTWDQVKLRLETLQQDQITGLHLPTYAWLTRHRVTPGSPWYDATLARLYEQGKCNPFRGMFRAPGWPYVKPMEDAAAEDLAERRNLRSLKRILADRGIDHTEHVVEVVNGRAELLEAGIERAAATIAKYPDAKFSLAELAREFAYGNDPGGIQYALNANGEAEVQSNPNATRGPLAKGGAANNTEKTETAQ